MIEKSSTNYVILHLRFHLRVPPEVFLANSREAATIIASTQGLIWKMWLLQEQDSEVGGVYLFADSEAAVAYLNNPTIRAVRSSPAVVFSQFQLWDVENSLSALTRAPLPDIDVQYRLRNASVKGAQ